MAAVLLAISAEHLVYSREPLVESTGLFFATLAGFVYLRRLVATSSSARAPTGVGRGAVGAAFACNNRLLYLPVCIGVFELVVTWRERNRQLTLTLIRRGAALAAGCLLPILAIEAAFLTAQALSTAAGSTPGFLDYAHQFVNFMRMNPASRARLDQWPTFFADLGLMDGLPLLALLRRRPGVLVVRRTWSRADALLAVCLFVPVVLFSVYSSGEVRMRNFSVALPWAMLLAALGLYWLAERTRYPGPVVCRRTRAARRVGLAARRLDHDRPERDPRLSQATLSRQRHRARGVDQRPGTQLLPRRGPHQRAVCGQRSSTPKRTCAIAAEYPYVKSTCRPTGRPGRSPSARPASRPCSRPQRQRHPVSGRPAGTPRHRLGRMERHPRRVATPTARQRRRCACTVPPTSLLNWFRRARAAPLLREARLAQAGDLGAKGFHHGVFVQQELGRPEGPRPVVLAQVLLPPPRRGGVFAIDARVVAPQMGGQQMRNGHRKTGRSIVTSTLRCTPPSARGVKPCAY